MLLIAFTNHWCTWLGLGLGLGSGLGLEYSNPSPSPSPSPAPTPEQVCTNYPGARLQAFGSSVSGLGSNGAIYLPCISPISPLYLRPRLQWRGPRPVAPAA